MWVDIGPSRGCQHRKALPETAHPFRSRVCRLGQAGNLPLVDRTNAGETDMVQLMSHCVLELLALHLRIEIQENGGVARKVPDKAVGRRLDHWIHLRADRSVFRKV